MSSIQLNSSINPHSFPIDQNEANYITLYPNMAQVSHAFKADASAGQLELTYDTLQNDVIDQTVSLFTDGGGEVYYQSTSKSNSFSIDRFLKDNLGQNITFTIYDQQAGLSYYSAKLLEFNGKEFVCSIGNRIHYFEKASVKSFSLNSDVEIEEPIEPNFRALYQTDVNETLCGELSYLTPSLNWSSIYQLVITDEDGSDIKAKLHSMASIENRTQRAFKNAKIELVAADANFNHQIVPMPRAYAMCEAAQMKAGNSNAAINQLWQDYSAYLVPFDVTIGAKQKIKVMLDCPREINLNKEYQITSHQRECGSKSPQVYYVAKNIAENNLNQSFARGTVQLYKQKEFSKSILGESQIGNISKGEDLKISVGQSQDVTFNRQVFINNIERNDEKQILSQKVTVELEVKNLKDHPVKLKLDENLPIDKKLIESDFELTHVNAEWAHAELELQPSLDKQKLSYSYIQYFK